MEVNGTNECQCNQGYYGNGTLCTGLCVIRQYSQKLLLFCDAISISYSYVFICIYIYYVWYKYKVYYHSICHVCKIDNNIHPYEKSSAIQTLIKHISSSYWHWLPSPFLLCIQLAVFFYHKGEGCNNTCDVNASCIKENEDFLCQCILGFTGDGITCTGIVSIFYCAHQLWCNFYCH